MNKKNKLDTPFEVIKSVFPPSMAKEIWGTYLTRSSIEIDKAQLLEIIKQIHTKRRVRLTKELTSRLYHKLDEMIIPQVIGRVV